MVNVCIADIQAGARVDLRQSGLYKQNKKMASEWKYVEEILGKNASEKQSG